MTAMVSRRIGEKDAIFRFGFWPLEIPLAYWLAIKLGLQSNRVYFSIAIAECSMAAVSAVLFKRGKWKAQTI